MPLEAFFRLTVDCCLPRLAKLVPLFSSIRPMARLVCLLATVRNSELLTCRIGAV